MNRLNNLENTEWLKELIKSPLIKWLFIIAFILILGMLITFFIQYNIDRTKGRSARFLWFESKPIDRIDTIETNKHLPTQLPVDREKETKTPTTSSIINNTTTENDNSINIQDSKNINTGTNYGNIGDVYKGIEQRHFKEEDAKTLIAEIENFKRQHGSKINVSHMTIGYPGDKESTIVAKEVEQILKANGYSNIEFMILITHGISGRLFDVSNAPDDTILIGIYPADNVQ